MNKKSLIYVVVSATFFGISPPFAKLLLRDYHPMVLAGLLYLGAFIGLTIFSIGRMLSKKRSAFRNRPTPLSKKDLPWLAGATITGGILAPVSMMLGLSRISGFSASLLLNLEGVATAVIAVFLFKENAGKRTWLALTCMTVAGFFLTWNPSEGKFNIVGPVLLIFAMVCWGFDNNFTRNISDKDAIQIAQIKGLVAGTTVLCLALLFGIKIPLNIKVAFALLLGGFSYGFSLVLFIKALEGLGSFRTGLFFSFAPFIGAITSLVLLKEWLGWVLIPATIFMILGVWLISSEKHLHQHTHEKITHSHSHIHTDMHHPHEHSEPFREPHAHEHTHPETVHNHEHFPDSHHRHEHKK